VRFAVRLLRFCIPPAFAAFILASVEILRTWLFGAVALGGAGQGLALGLCVLGLLGAPLLLGGFAVTATRALVAAGWRWGQGSAPEIEPARRAAWAIHGALTLGVSVVAVQGAVVAFVQMMRKPVYQGLAAGLVGALALLVMLALAGPLVGVWARLLERLRRVLPRALDPTTAAGAGLWVVAFSVLGGLLAPVLLVELRSVDLRPAWMGLLYAVLLGVGFKGAAWLCERAPRLAAGALLAALLLPALGLGFAARSVGGVRPGCSRSTATPWSPVRCSDACARSRIATATACRPCSAAVTATTRTRTSGPVATTRRTTAWTRTARAAICA
jgi:hypothetical protein